MQVMQSSYAIILYSIVLSVHLSGKDHACDNAVRLGKGGDKTLWSGRFFSDLTFFKKKDVREFAL